jgi:hypothetical protein
MYIPSTYQVITYFLQKLVTKVKPNINSVEVHPQLSKNRMHPVDGAMVGAGSLWPFIHTLLIYLGPLYTRSQGQCSTQIKHSYWWKSGNKVQHLLVTWGQTTSQKMLKVGPKFFRP